MVNFIARIRLSSGVLNLCPCGKERESQASDRQDLHLPCPHSSSPIPLTIFLEITSPGSPWVASQPYANSCLASWMVKSSSIPTPQVVSFSACWCSRGHKQLCVFSWMVKQLSPKRWESFTSRKMARMWNPTPSVMWLDGGAPKEILARFPTSWEKPMSPWSTGESATTQSITLSNSWWTTACSVQAAGKGKMIRAAYVN